MEKGLIDLREIRPRNYEQFLLQRNPFPAIGIPSEVPPFTSDREPLKEGFKNVMANLQEREESIITVLVGEYGSGKSHLLKVFKQSVNNYLFSWENGTFAIYIKSPGEDFRDFFLKLIEDIGSDFFARSSEKTIEKYLRENKTKIVPIIYEKNIKELFESGSYNVGEILSGCQYLTLFSWIKNEYFQKIGSSDVVSAFLNLSHIQHSSRAWRWLLGESLDKDEKGYLGVSTTIKDSDMAYSIFRDLLILLRSIGIKNFVILVDEFEKITSIHSTKKKGYQDLLRNLIDDYPKNLCLYFAISPSQWASLIKEETALVRRLAGNWYTLDKFDKPYTKELIEMYLDSARVKKFSTEEAKNRFGDCEPSLCPFTNESVDSIHEISGGVVADILKLCRKVLEALHDHQDIYKSVTPELVNFVKKEAKIK